MFFPTFFNFVQDCGGYAQGCGGYTQDCGGYAQDCGGYEQDCRGYVAHRLYSDVQYLLLEFFWKFIQIAGHNRPLGKHSYAIFGPHITPPIIPSK